MSVPDSVRILPVPKSLHLELAQLLRDIFATGAQIHAAQLAYNDLLTTSGRVLDELAKFTAQVEDLRNAAKAVEENSQGLGAAQPEDASEGTYRGRALDLDLGSAPEGRPSGHVGQGDAGPLPEEESPTTRAD